MNEAPRFSVRAAAWGTCIVATIAAFILFRATGTSVKLGSLAVMAGFVLILGLLHVIYTRWRPDPYIAPITGGLAVLTWAGMVSGMAALAALRTGAPLIDASLAHADAIFGLDTPAFVKWLTLHASLMPVLDLAYKSTVPLVFVAVILLSLTRRETFMWELCFVFAGSAAFCAFLTAIIPAVAAFSYYGTSPETIALLPTGAGQYFLPTLVAYHSRILDTVDVFHLEGVVTFPSFHAAMALMTAYALRDLRVLSGVFWGWGSLILISTIPIGGHYAVDLVGGAVVWAAFTLPVQGQAARRSRAMADRASSSVDTHP